MKTIIVSALLAIGPLGMAAEPPGLRDWLERPVKERAELAKRPFAARPLSKAEAAEARRMLWTERADRVRAGRQKEWDDKVVVGDKHTMKLLTKTFGTKPEKGWNLFISMHGGGNARAEVNDQQWQNQIRLYQPRDSIYIAPRAPTNTWNLWHESHVDDLFGRLIETAIVVGDVDPNRVYIMGYSAGGDGVYQLAPRMADRLAAAAMMAGHPNDASPLGLRNIGFALHVGERDGGYKRNEMAKEWKSKLGELREADPQGYAHDVQIHGGLGHWMNLKDAVAVDWMQKFTRNPRPDVVVWKQSNRTHDRFYWLAMPAGQAKGGQHVVARRKGQEVEIEKAEGVTSLTVLLSDAMMDLDRPVRITRGGRELFQGKVNRTIDRLAATLAERGDPELVFDAAVTVKVGP